MEDDITVVQEKDVLLQEMLRLSDISSDCDLAPVCIDNIVCQLPRDAFDVIMIHGSIEESNSEFSSPASSMEPTSSRQADLNLLQASVYGSAEFADIYSHAGIEREIEPIQSRHPRRSSQPRTNESRGPARNTGPQNSHNGPSRRAEATRMRRSVSHSNRPQPANLNGSSSSTDMEVIRSSLEEALRAVQEQQMSDSQPPFVATPPNAKEAAAQAAIRRSQIAQQVFQDYLSSLQPALQQRATNESANENPQLAANLSTIQNTMQEIQNAVTKFDFHNLMSNRRVKFNFVLVLVLVQRWRNQ